MMWTLRPPNTDIATITGMIQDMTPSTLSANVWGWKTKDNNLWLTTVSTINDLFSSSYVHQYATLFSIRSLSHFHNMFQPHVAIFRCSSLDGTCCTAMPFLHSILVFGPRGSASYLLVPSVICNVRCLLCLLFNVCYILPCFVLLFEVLC
jgi:hypothetical protein